MEINFTAQNVFKGNNINNNHHVVKQQIDMSQKADCFCKSVNANTVVNKDFEGIKIEKSFFGKTKKGENAQLYTITNKNGAKVSLSTFGATITSIKVPDKNGKMVDVLQGYDSVEGYDGTPVGHSGGTIGPCANKIADGKFSINGKEYQLECNKDKGKSHCHGAGAGFDIINWNSEIVENGIKFTYTKPDMEGGYPGNVKTSVTYTFDNNNKLNVKYEATTDKDTVLNLTNHAYFNLDGAENAEENSVLDHKVQLPNSTKYTQNNEIAIPTGEIKSVKGTPFDFSEMRRVGDRISEDFDQLKIGAGYDQNYCIDGYNGKDLIKAATVVSDKTGIKMDVSTNLPGFQFYTSNHLGKPTQPLGKDGKRYEKRSGLCVEPQFYPNAINTFDEKPILKAGQKYDRTIVYEFGTEK